MSSQWRNQDFPEGAPTSEFRPKTYYLITFLPKIERNLTKGACIPNAPLELSMLLLQLPSHLSIISLTRAPHQDKVFYQDIFGHPPHPTPPHKNHFGRDCWTCGPAWLLFSPEIGNVNLRCTVCAFKLFGKIKNVGLTSPPNSSLPPPPSSRPRDTLPLSQPGRYT